MNVVAEAMIQKSLSPSDVQVVASGVLRIKTPRDSEMDHAARSLCAKYVLESPLAWIHPVERDIRKLGRYALAIDTDHGIIAR